MIEKCPICGSSELEEYIRFELFISLLKNLK